MRESKDDQQIIMYIKHYAYDAYFSLEKFFKSDCFNIFLFFPLSLGNKNVSRRKCMPVLTVLAFNKNNRQT